MSFHLLTVAIYVILKAAQVTIGVCQTLSKSMMKFLVEIVKAIQRQPHKMVKQFVGQFVDELFERV